MAGKSRRERKLQSPLQKSDQQEEKLQKLAERGRVVNADSPRTVAEDSMQGRIVQKNGSERDHQPRKPAIHAQIIPLTAHENARWLLHLPLLRLTQEDLIFSELGLEVHRKKRNFASNGQP
eukprot:3453408-Rhodomonas_salina.3